LTPQQISAIDAAHIWHPYSSIGGSAGSGAVPPVVAVGAKGAWLTVVRDGTEIGALDAMASWWTAIHGHGHPVLDAAITRQLHTMNHVMFGGLTHEPAARLAQLLVDITPVGLDTVFFSDSGSVAVAQHRPIRQAQADDLAGRLSRGHLHPDERLRSRRRNAQPLARRCG
jgi:adenosylmethionine-8-amino-7-oxononanoate aminotransferase